MTIYKALFVQEIENGQYQKSIVERNTDDLPEGDLLIKVRYSSLNFKDAMSAHGNKGVTRKFPHQPGIDAAGVVEQSAPNAFKVGDKVIVTGYDLGMNTAGGLGQYIRVPAHWVVKCPEGMSLKQSMHFGTAGLTAALCINKLVLNGLTPDQGPVLVTGATGGVGGIAVMLLAKLGYKVVASSGKVDQKDFLISIGASEVIERGELAAENKRPMLKELYAAAIDVAGGNTLSNVIKSVKYGGSVASCGLVQAADFSSSVFPFILRNVNLLGVDSVELPLPMKAKIWQQLSSFAEISSLGLLNEEIRLEQVVEHLDRLYTGGMIGHILVDMG